MRTKQFTFNKTVKAVRKVKAIEVNLTKQEARDILACLRGEFHLDPTNCFKDDEEFAEARKAGAVGLDASALYAALNDFVG